MTPYVGFWKNNELNPEECTPGPIAILPRASPGHVYDDGTAYSGGPHLAKLGQYSLEKASLETSTCLKISSKKQRRIRLSVVAVYGMFKFLRVMIRDPV